MLNQFFRLPVHVDNGMIFKRGSIIGWSALLLFTTMAKNCGTDQIHSIGLKGSVIGISEKGCQRSVFKELGVHIIECSIKEYILW